MKKHALFLCLASTLAFGTAHGDSRFSAGEAVDGHGSFGSGSVTVHHNLLPAERAELEAEIADLRNQLDALRGALDNTNDSVANVASKTDGLDSRVRSNEQTLSGGLASNLRIEAYSRTRRGATPVTCNSGDTATKQTHADNGRSLVDCVGLRNR